MCLHMVLVVNLSREVEIFLRYLHPAKWLYPADEVIITFHSLLSLFHMYNSFKTSSGNPVKQKHGVFDYKSPETVQFERQGDFFPV